MCVETKLDHQLKIKEEVVFFKIKSVWEVNKQTYSTVLSVLLLLRAATAKGTIAFEVLEALLKGTDMNQTSDGLLTEIDGLGGIYGDLLNV